MRKVRQGIALFAVLTLLLTSLLPAAALAADVPEAASATRPKIGIHASVDPALPAAAGSSLYFTAVVDGVKAKDGDGT